MNGRPQPRILLTLDEVAERLGVSRRTVNEWIKRKRIRVTHIGARTPRVTEEDYFAFVEEARGDAGS
jgi:excisionase family DNA binding protein